MNYFDGITILDGAMGTELVKMKAPMGKIPEELNITHPELVKSVHESYLKAGSKLIYTCTFGANAYKMKGSSYSVKEVIKASVKNALEAAKPYGAKVFLSMGTIGAILEPYGSLKFEEAVEIYREMVTAGEEAGVHGLVFETQTDLLEVKAGVIAAKESTHLPIFVTMTFEKNGRTFTGTSVEAMAVTLTAMGVDAIGVNCSLGPDELLPLVEKMRAFSDLPIIVKPNAGLPDPMTGEYSMTPSEFANAMRPFLKMGVSMVGGCCGTNPDYINDLSVVASEYKPVKPEKNTASYLSGNRTVVDVNSVHVVGERINPTGKKLFKEAILNHDIDYIKARAIEQVEAGAEILDVNVGLPTIDEVSFMREVVKELQTIVDVPLQIDSSNPEVIEAALRIYSGKALINSVNGEDESLNAILPIAKKYGAAVIGLTMDKDGIPKSCAKRTMIAKKIIGRCHDFGIETKDIYIDCLTLTAGVQQDQVEETLNAIREVKSRYGVHTVLGVSNISFGLPKRELVNTTFLTMAMGAGLDLPIINPNNEAMMGAVDAFLLLTSQDKKCAHYVAKYADSGEKTVKAPTDNNGKTIGELIKNGLSEQTAQKVSKLLETQKPLDIVNSELIPALDRVGADFECGKSFLPQLLSSAQAAEAGFNVIRQYMASKNETGLSKGKIVLATVKGDVHDIGKNIVKTLLENYGYTVIDLGRDVEPSLVVTAAKEHKVKLVGLSALMTTTVPSMEETIKEIREAKLDCKVMVGGAVLTPEFAEKIGADYYAKDAKQSADIAKKIYE